MTNRVKRVPWSSKITQVATDRLITHGVDQRDIIRDFSYEEMVFFLLLKRKPSPVERDLLRAILVAHCSHGITGQSTLAVMEAADCRSDFLHALIAGFSVGAGIYHQGGLRATMEDLTRWVDVSAEDLEGTIERHIASGQRLMGFGHRYHIRDPRVTSILAVAESHGFRGKFLDLALRIEHIVGPKYGLHMNIEAGGGSILLDLGFNARIGHLFIVIGRSPMFAAAYLERLEQGRKPFQRIEIVDLVDDVE